MKSSKQIKTNEPKTNENDSLFTNFCIYGPFTENVTRQVCIPKKMITNKMLNKNEEKKEKR